MLFWLTTIYFSCNYHKTADKKYNELNDTDYKHDSDIIEGETVYFKTATTKIIPEKISNLDKEQELFIKQCLEGADSLIRTHFPNSNINNFTTNTLDDLIDLWNSDSTKFNCSKNYL